MNCGATRMWVGSALMVLGLAGCGQDTGYLYEKAPVRVKDERGEMSQFGLNKASYSSLKWYMQCPSNPMVVPAPQPREMVLDGAGPHPLIRERLVGTPVTVYGRVCPPPAYARDIVFIVSVDGTFGLIRNGDLPVNNSCKRLQALESMIDAMPAGTNFGLVAFEEEIQGQSTGLFSTKATLFANVVAAARTADPAIDHISDVVCKAGGATFFELGLQAAKELLQGGRPNGIHKQIVVISDGSAVNDPNTAIDEIARAVDLASSIRASGITINGETLRSELGAINIPTDSPDRILGQLVSQDAGGQPILQRFGSHMPVASALATLAANRLVAADVGFRVAEDAAWQRTNVFPLISTTDFVMAPFFLPIDGTQAGVDLELSYTDVYGGTNKVGGQVRWSDVQ